MRGKFRIIVAAGAIAVHGPALADASPTFEPSSQGASGTELSPYLQCVPYARQLSGVQIYGDAHTWWEQAAGRYERGNAPRVGAVMAFVPHRNMQLGHVAAISRVVDNRTVLLDHANWSPINGRRGQIERNVLAVDVSPANDWSQVRVWYGPIQGLGTTPWPVHGFIYGTRAASAQPRLAAASQPKVPALPSVSADPSRAFMTAFSDMPAPIGRRADVRAERGPGPQPLRKVMPQRRETPAQSRRDPIATAIARYGN